jgi:hypothetical protein
MKKQRGVFVYVVRAACVLSPKPHFLILISFASLPELSYVYTFPILSLLGTIFVLKYYLVAPSK